MQLTRRRPHAPGLTLTLALSIQGLVLEFLLLLLFKREAEINGSADSLDSCASIDGAQPRGGMGTQTRKQSHQHPSSCPLVPTSPPPKGSNYLFLWLCTSILLYKYTTSQISILLFTPLRLFTILGPRRIVLLRTPLHASPGAQACFLWRTYPVVLGTGFVYDALEKIVPGSRFPK